MGNNEGSSVLSEYFSARSRSASTDSDNGAYLAPLGDATQGNRSSIGVSNSIKRKFKDKRIYVNPRTGLPVRPPTSFGLFKHTLRRTIKEKKVGFLEFNKMATEQWLKMSDHDKSPYVQRAKKLAEQFKKIEVHYLRKKLRQLKAQMQIHRRDASQKANKRNRV